MRPQPRQINIQAYAKVNLTLEVLCRRPDQYHELRSVVQTISLADEIELHPNSPGTKLRLSGYPIPSGDDNLVMATLRQVEDRLGLTRDVELILKKRIPPGRGLGGGSSDAAALLRAMGCLHDWRISRQKLYSLAAELGSDVPLFLKGGSLLMAGRGESLERLAEPVPDYAMVLTWPEISVPTEVAYSLLEPEDFSDGTVTEKLWKHLQQGGRPQPGMLHNCFERAVFQRWPEVAALHERLSELAGVRASLTGSGSGLFLISDQAEQLAEHLRATGYEACVARPVDIGHRLSCDPPWWENRDGEQ